LFLIAQIIGLLYGLLTGWWIADGGNIEQILESMRWARRITIAVAAFLIYLAFFRRVPSHLFFHAVAVFVVGEALSIFFEFSFTNSLINLISWPYLVAHFAILSLALLVSKRWGNAGLD